MAKGLKRIWLDHPVYGRETVGEFLKRHQIPVAKDGTFILFHGRPRSAKFKVLRKSSYLEADPERAAFFAMRDRGLKKNDVEVLSIELEPDDIDPGVHITTRRSVQLDNAIVLRRK